MSAIAGAATAKSAQQTLNTKGCFMTELSLFRQTHQSIGCRRLVAVESQMQNSATVNNWH
jgi:hypothetical protein